MHIEHQEEYASTGTVAARVHFLHDAHGQRRLLWAAEDQYDRMEFEREGCQDVGVVCSKCPDIVAFYLSPETQGGTDR